MKQTARDRRQVRDTECHAGDAKKERGQRLAEESLRLLHAALRQATHPKNYAALTFPFRPVLTRIVECEKRQKGASEGVTKI